MKRKLFMFLALCLMTIGSVLAQTQVRGTIVDEHGDPAIGASIQIKGTTQGTTTDIDGNFTLSAPANGTLVISYVGYQTQEVAVAATLNIVLKTDAEMLDDVVVIGYSQRKLAATSASVVKVSSKEIKEKPTANPFDAIQGKVSGLQVYTSSGEPSAISSIRLHGTGSLGAGSSPLYILDGVPVTSGAIQSLNHNDIESFQFLKDAAATSIYGARAANGVVYITTKKGVASERAQISVRGQYGVSKLANTAYFDQLMNTDEMLRYMEEVGIQSPEQIQKIRDQYGMNDYKWYNFYYQDAPTYNADVNISGGKGSTNYYISSGFLRQQGLRAGSDYKKMNLRMNLNSALNDIIKVGLNSSVSYDFAKTNPFEGNNTTGGGIAVMAPPYYTPYDENGNEYYDKIIPGWQRYNPKFMMANQQRNNETLYLNLAGNVTITPFENFTIRSTAGLELSDYTFHYFYNPSYPAALGDGAAERDFSRSMTFTTNTTAEYKFNVADDHNFSALIGHEFVDYDYSSFYAYGTGLVDDRLMLLGNITKDKELGESFSEYAFLSYFGQFSYDYLNKYYLDLVVRNDASSRFGKNRRNATFWSTGLLWKLKKEDFLQSASWLNDLDLKFSIGTQGNADIASYKANPLVGTTSQFNGKVGWGLSTPGNPDLGWEKQTKATIGITTRMFDRLGVNLEFYNRVTSDMLMDVPMPYTTGNPLDAIGFASITSNVGKYQNRGIDLRIDYDFLKGRDYDLSGYLNFNYNKDKVLELFQGRDSWILPGYGFGYIVGQPVVFVYPIFKGINPDNGYAEWYIPGDNVAEKVTDDSKVTPYFNDNLEQNTGIPLYTPMTGGFGLSGSYKGFYMTADFGFALGKHMISNDKYFFENPLSFMPSLNQNRSVFDYWKKPGDNARFPSLEYNYNIDSRITWFDSKMIENASFMRMKNLTVGYQIPANFLKSQKVFTAAKVYVTARNLFTITNYQGMDPEVDSNLSFGANPNTKQFMVGAEISF